MAFRLLSTITSLHPQNIPGRTRNFPNTPWVRYSSDGPRYFRQPSSCRSSSSRTSKTPLPSPTRLHVILGRPDEDPGVLRSPFASMIAQSCLCVSSASVPKTSEESASLALALVHVWSCPRAPSATGPKVVSPTVAPRSLGSIFGRGRASTLWAPSTSRSATLRAGRRDGGQRSTVHVHRQKSCTLVEEAKFSCS